MRTVIVIGVMCQGTHATQNLHPVWLCDAFVFYVFGTIGSFVFNDDLPQRFIGSQFQDPWCGVAKVFWHLASQHNGSLIPGQERFSPFQSLNVFSRIQGSDTFSLHSLHTCWNPFNSLSKWEPSLWRGMRRGPWGRPRMSQLLQNYLLHREETGAQNAGTAQNMSSWIIEVQTNYCYFQLILQFHLFCST